MIYAINTNIELIERGSDKDLFFSALLLLVALLIAIVRLTNQGVIISLFLSIFNIRNTTDFTSESLKSNPITSMILLGNFILSFILCVKLSNIYQSEGVFQWLFSVGISLAFIFSRIFNILFIGVITGEQKLMRIPLIQFMVGIEFIGIIYGVLAIFWTFNPQWHTIFLSTFYFLFLFFFGIRIFKGIVSIFMQGVSWYYIILYLCTLEILPILVIYYLYMKDLVKF